MDNKVRKYYLSKLLLGFFGFFIGGALFALLGGSGTFYRLLASAAFSGILFILSEFVTAKKTPTLKYQVEMEERDERGLLIKGKAGVFTVMFMMVVLLLILFLGAFIENPLISYGAAGLALLQLTVFFASSFFWSSKL